MQPAERPTLRCVTARSATTVLHTDVALNKNPDSLEAQRLHKYQQSGHKEPVTEKVRFWERTVSTATPWLRVK